MEKKKKDYVAPDIEVTQVEIESAICNGSVEFGKDKTGAIEIDNQQFADMNGTNDFSSTEWIMPTNTEN